MNAKTQANVMLEIIYAAYATHIKVAQSKAIAASGMDADTFAKRHWDQNLPGVQTLWTGLVKAIISNVAITQSKGELPALIEAKFTDPLLPGLGGAPLGQQANTAPAALARRLAGHIRGRIEAATGVPPLDEGTRPVPAAPARDTVPGLAVGRCTGDEPCEGEHREVLDAIDSHIRGSDEE